MPVKLIKYFLRSKKGLSLAEITISVIILSAALVGTLNVFSLGFDTVWRAKVKSNQLVIAVAKMEEILSYMSLSLAPSHTLAELVTTYNGENQNDPLGPDGAAIPYYAGYARTVSVEYVNENDISTVSAGATRIVRVIVTVGGLTSPFSLVTFLYR